MTFRFRKFLPFLFGLVLLYYALKDVSIKDLYTPFNEFDPVMLLIISFVYIVNVFFRAIRWQMQLQPLGFRPKVVRLMIAIQSAFIGSMILPAGGELTRCLTLQRTDGVPLSKSVGLIVAERIVDLLGMALLFLLTFFVEVNRLRLFYVQINFIEWLGFIEWILILIVVASFLGFFLKNLIISFLKNMNKKMIVKKIRSIIEELWQGFYAIRHLQRPGLYVILTFVLQGTGIIITYCYLKSMNSTQELPPMASVTVLAFAALGGLAIPTQGSIGTYHFFVSRALVLYGLSTVKGALAATFMHAIGFGINLIFSSVCFLIIPSLVQQRQEKLRAEQES